MDNTNKSNGVTDQAASGLLRPSTTDDDSQSTRSTQPHVDVPGVHNTSPRHITSQPALEQPIESSDHQPRPFNMHAVRGFTPEPIIPAARAPQPTSTPHSMSGLSASLATVSMHYPQKESQSLPSATEQPVAFNHRVESQSRPGASVLNVTRKTDEGLDMATSYRFFLVEEQMQKRHQPTADLPNPIKTPPTPAPAQVNDQPTKSIDPTASSVKSSGNTSTPSPTSPTGKSKKKVVTFDVKPAVVTITREVEAEKAAEAASNFSSQDLVFDLEEDDPGYASGESSMPPFLREPVVAPRNSQKVSRKPDLGLPTSYQAVRPASLPNPSSLSALRPPTSRAQVSSPLSQPPSQPQSTTTAPESKLDSKGPKEDDPRDQEILKLVAADVPSHRGAWKRDTRAWETFTKRPDHRNDSTVNGQEVDSEDEEISETISALRSRLLGSTAEEPAPMYVGSLPVAIKPIGPRKQELSLASYKPKSVLESASLTSVPTLSHRRHSSAAMRRAAYAERDKLRSLDPGALDFAVDEESDDDQGDETGDIVSVDPRDSDKGSLYALRILHARNSIPEAGVWASLA